MTTKASFGFLCFVNFVQFPFKFGNVPNLGFGSLEYFLCQFVFGHARFLPANVELTGAALSRSARVDCWGGFLDVPNFNVVPLASKIFSHQTTMAVLGCWLAAEQTPAGY